MTEEYSFDRDFILSQFSEKGVSQIDKNLARRQIAFEITMRYQIYTVTQDNGKQEMHMWKNSKINGNGFTRTLILRAIDNILGDYSTEADRKEIIAHIASMTQTDASEIDNEPATLINFINGVYDIETGQFDEHAIDEDGTEYEDYKFLSVIPHKYDPKAKCPECVGAVSDWFDTKDAEEHDDNYLTYQEVAGYSLYRSNFLKKAVIFEGRADGGKTTALSLIINMLGIKNVTGISIQELCHDPFSKINLRGKMANICDDMGKMAIKDVGPFKMVIGNSLITANQKGKDYVEFYNYATLMFGTNRIPQAPNLDIADQEAYYSKFIILPFRNEFPRIDGFDKKLFQETPGFINWALQGLKRLLHNKKFTNDRHWEEIKYHMERQGGLGDFINNCCVVTNNPDDLIPKSVFYDKFVEYLKENPIFMNDPIPGIKSIARTLPLQNPNIKSTFDKTKRIRCWSNLKVAGVDNDKVIKDILEDISYDTYNPDSILCE